MFRKKLVLTEEKVITADEVKAKHERKPEMARMDNAKQDRKF